MLTNDTMIHVSFMLRLGYIYGTFINSGPEYLAYHLFLWTSQPLVTALIGQLTHARGSTVKQQQSS